MRMRTILNLARCPGLTRSLEPVRFTVNSQQQRDQDLTDQIPRATDQADDPIRHLMLPGWASLPGFRGHPISHFKVLGTTQSSS